MQLTDLERALRGKGKSEATINATMRFVRAFRDWLEAQGTSLTEANEDLASIFLSARYGESPYSLRDAGRALRAWGHHVLGQSWFSAAAATPAGDMADSDMSAFVAWLRERGRMPQTVRAYQNRIVGFLSWWKSRDGAPFEPANWTTEDTLAYENHVRSHGATESTVAAKLAAVTAFADWLATHNRLPTNPIPAGGASQPMRKKARTVRWLEEADANRLLHVLTTRAVNETQPSAMRQAHRDLAICLLMLDAGLQLHEVCDMRPEQIQEDALILPGTEAGSTRQVPATHRLLHALTRWLEQRGPVQSPFLFGAQRAEQITPRAIQHLAHQWQQLAALPEWFTPATLRHSFCRRLALQGLSRKQIAALTGTKAPHHLTVYFDQRRNHHDA